MKKFIPLLLLLLLPTFIFMLRSGIYTTHDFHPFRQYEFNICAREPVFPCRWAPDSGMGYGEPVFNFYGQFPYWVGQLFIFSGLSILTAVKLTFILSLLLSGLFMYLWSFKYWGPAGGLLSALLYVYAPYRAVDVWVRGALPESLAFVFFPLILYILDRYSETKKTFHLLLLALTGAALINTHNLSAFMFLPFLILWWLFKSAKAKTLFTTKYLILAGFLCLGLSAFYLFPVATETSLTTLNRTTEKYYESALHYTTLNQLFISRFWGYGGSVWGPNDTMSFSVGHLHWFIPIVLFVYLLIQRLRRQALPPHTVYTLLALSFGFFALFLTHGKSDVLWRIVPGIRFIQFPWRFLGLAALFLSFAGGYLGLVFKNYKYLLSLFAILIILVSFSFFRPDRWLNVNDAQYFSGLTWDEQRASSLQDYWPVSAGAYPASSTDNQPLFITGVGSVTGSQKLAHSAQFDVEITPPSALIQLPIVYFPAWQVSVDGHPARLVESGSPGMVIEVPGGKHTISARFYDTLPRQSGNMVSLLSLLVLLLVWFRMPKYVSS